LDVEIRSLLSVPLVCKGALIGVLNLYNKKDGSFTTEDQRLLAIIASQSAQVIENARLYEQEEQLRQYEQELEMARSIQDNILPKSGPKVSGFEIAGRSYAAKEVGGDYFDFLELGEGKIGLALGDVSGKGVPAALLMSNLQATLRNQAISSTTVSQSVINANHFLFLNTDSNKFATLFFGVLDSTNGKFIFVNAGHNFPYLVRANDDYLTLEKGGIVLGMLPDFPCEEGEVELKKGDLLLIFSDGVTEAENLLEDQYGETRLLEYIKKIRPLSAEQMIDSLYQEVTGFAGQKTQDDDITIVIIKAV